MTDGMAHDDDARFLEADPDAREVLRFSVWNGDAEQSLRAIVYQLPVREFVHDATGIDTWASSEFAGDAEAVVERLSAAIARDRQRVAAELSNIVNHETVVMESTFRPDALHVITRLSSKAGMPGSIIYGARVQRIAEEVFVLWSDF